MTTNVKTNSKELVKGENLKKESKVSLFTLMQNSNKVIKAEVFSLSGAIKNFNTLPANDKFLTTAKVQKSDITPAYVLKNILNVPNFKSIEDKIYQTVTIKTVKTDKLKEKWSHYQVLQAIYYSVK